MQAILYFSLAIVAALAQTALAAPAPRPIPANMLPRAEAVAQAPRGTKNVNGVFWRRNVHYEEDATAKIAGVFM